MLQSDWIHLERFALKLFQFFPVQNVLNNEEISTIWLFQHFNSEGIDDGGAYSDARMPNRPPDTAPGCPG